MVRFQCVTGVKNKELSISMRDFCIQVFVLKYFFFKIQSLSQPGPGTSQVLSAAMWSRGQWSASGYTWHREQTTACQSLGILLFSFQSNLSFN